MLHQPTPAAQQHVASAIRSFLKLLGMLLLASTLIGGIRLALRYQRVGELRQRGRHLTGTVLDKSVTFTKSGKNSRDRHDYVNLRTTLDGQLIDTPLDDTRDIIDELQIGQPLEVVYLPEDKWKNAAGEVGFFDDHRPVPLAFVQQNTFTSSYAWLTYALAGCSLLLLLLLPKRR